MTIWEKNVNSSISAYADSSYEKYKSYDRFKFVKDIAGKNLKNGGDLLDIGCSKGELIWYLKDFFPDVSFTGIDISKALISIAEKEEKLKNDTFVVADAQQFSLNKEFDFVIMSGVLSIFDDHMNIIDQMIKHLKIGGSGYIFGIFTEHDIDVLVRFKNNYLKSEIWESGYNMFSLNTIKATLTRFSEDVVLHKFNLHVDLAKKDNPVDSYTLNTHENGKIILCGANILSEFYLIEFKRSR